MAEDHFGAEVAARYDEDEAAMFAPAVLQQTVDCLDELAAGRPVLEFAIGTGRVALALAAAGAHVQGIDLSAAMVEQLRAKPGGDAIPVTIGDFSTTGVSGMFRLVYLVFNTIGNLTTQDAQVACFANAARHLEPGGHFLIEVGVPDLQRLPFGERVRAFEVSDEHVGFDEYDVASQAMASHHFYPQPDGTWRRGWTPFRYVWPAELDLMARLAGMTLTHRWADWDRSPFTATSEKHISVWTRTG